MPVVPTHLIPFRDACDAFLRSGCIPPPEKHELKDLRVLNISLAFAERRAERHARCRSAARGCAAHALPPSIYLWCLWWRFFRIFRNSPLLGAMPKQRAASGSHPSVSPRVRCAMIDLRQAAPRRSAARTLRRMRCTGSNGCFRMYSASLVKQRSTRTSG